MPSQSSSRPRLGRWITVTGPNAYCRVCEWAIHASQTDPGDARRVMSAARFHSRDSGHEVNVQRGQSSVIR